MIAFYSTYESKNILNTPSYTININSGEIKCIASGSYTQVPTFTPDGKRIVYMSGKDCEIFPLEVQGADWWIVNADGSGAKRLTYMNMKNHPQSVNHYRLAGSLSFISDSCFLGGIMTNPLGLTGYTAKVEF